MSQQRELRRHADPTCFRVVRSIRPARSEHRHSADAHEFQKLRKQLAEVSEEARMNWDEFIRTRDQCKAFEEDLAELRRDNDRLSNRLRRFRARIGELGRARSQLADYAERINEAEHRTVQALAHAAAAGSEPAKAHGVQQAIDFARSNLHALSIPDEVVEAAAEALDRANKRASRGRKVMEALTALHAYAIDSARGGDFKHWCAQGGHAGVQISANQVAMSESQNVQQRNVMESQRSFPVDPALDLSGRRVMLAHIRIAQGESAPRLHFLDDTRGKTGKIHIGYIGPHLPTARDPK